MESGSSSGQSDLCHAAPFSALRWERSVADRLLDWRTTSGTALERMSTFAEAICRTLRQDGRRYTVPEEIALNLKPVLTSCDFLTFNNAAEAIAYAGLHLLDRYGRVNQVLEYLIRIGRHSGLSSDALRDGERNGPRRVHDRENRKSPISRP